MNPVPPLTGVECLAAWPIRLHTQRAAASSQQKSQSICASTWFAFHEHWRSAPWPPARPYPWDCTSRRWFLCRKNKDHVLGGSSSAPWLVGSPDTTSRLDSAGLGSDTGRVPGVELRPGHKTGHGQQDARSSAVGASESPETHVTNFPLGHRLPPGLAAPGAGILSPTKFV